MSKERDLLHRLVSWYHATGKGAPLDFIVSDAEKLLSEPEENTYHEGYRDGKAFANRHGEISLRDHFAGLAMQGLMTNSTMGDSAMHESSADWLKDITESAYEFSDAMLKEREKGNE